MHFLPSKRSSFRLGEVGEELILFANNERRETPLGNAFQFLFCAQSLSRVLLFATPQTVARQAALPMGILQARIVEWIAIPFSRGSFQPWDRTQVFHIPGVFFTTWATREVLLSFYSTITQMDEPGLPVQHQDHVKLCLPQITLVSQAQFFTLRAGKPLTQMKELYNLLNALKAWVVLNSNI